MSDSPDLPGSPAKLQFDRAEFATAAPVATCRACAQPVHDVYYEVNGHPFCENCRELLAQSLAGGSSTGRFLRAALFGSAAGLAGAAIFYIVSEMTKMRFGLVSILVGWMVGKAVSKGSHGRGGWGYQALAIFLTYTAIAATYLAPVIQILNDNQVAPGLSILPALISLAYTLPIRLGAHSPMGLIIIGIGLYEAWVTNRRAPLVINGPYQIARPDAGSAVHVDPTG